MLLGIRDDKLFITSPNMTSQESTGKNKPNVPVKLITANTVASKPARLVTGLDNTNR